jgi:RNA-directed DNA polymerase
VEEQSDPNSYGFRTYRSTHDAITRLRSLLDKRVSPQWILDADVFKCFDTISHNFLIRNTVICDSTVLDQWLTSGVMDSKNSFTKTIMGTPQGGIISPLLCNVALNGIEPVAIAASGKPSKNSEKPKVQLTRYADDFVVTGRTESILTNSIKPAIADFLEIRGLKLKSAKTRIVNIVEGFEFLGFNLQRKAYCYKLNNKTDQESVLIITPKKDNIQGVKEKIRKIVVPTKPLESIIKELNPILGGWAEYFRISYHSLNVFGELGHFVWQKVWSWARRRHPTRSAQWIFAKYIVSGSSRKWLFGITLKQSLFDISTVTHQKLFPIKSNLNPYVQDNIKYYQERNRKKIAAKFRAALYSVYLHICPHCGESLHNGEPVELHHVVPVKTGGKYIIDNMQPLHRVCHQSI